MSRIGREVSLRLRGGMALVQPDRLAFLPVRGLALFFALAYLGAAASLRFEPGRPFAAPFFVLMAALLLVAVFSPVRRSLLVSAYVVSYVAFINFRTVADDTLVPIHYTYPIALDGFFLGGFPGVWLQELLYVPGRIGVMDAVLTLVYLTYFASPHLTALVVWRTRPQLLPRVMVAIMLTWGVGLAVYFLLPTAPPWLASEEGHLGQVHRIVPELTAVLAGNLYADAAQTVDRNPVAAMPSLHAAITVVVACVMRRYGRAWQRIGAIYAVAMCLALVYLGEHYVVDVVAGSLLALAIWRFVSQRHTVVADGAQPELAEYLRPRSAALLSKADTPVPAQAGEARVP